MDSPPTFAELAPSEEAEKADTITRIVDCIREITSSKAEDDCSQLSKQKDRQAKEEPLSFVLSIEPVHENVVDLTRQSNGENRNPQALFVMLPNIDPPEVGEKEQLEVDGFIVDNIRAEALRAADTDRDDGSGDLRTLRP